MDSGWLRRVLTFLPRKGTTMTQFVFSGASTLFIIALFACLSIPGGALLSRAVVEKPVYELVEKRDG
jgi:hypothetical protein